MTLEHLIGAADADLSDPPLDTGTTVTPPNLEDMDSDDLLLMQARKELEAENNSTQTPPTTQTATPGTAPIAQNPAQPTPAAAPQGDGGAPARIMIPKERLDEVLSQKTERELRIAFLEGQLAAKQTAAPGAPQPATPAAPQPPTLDQQLSSIQNRVIDLAAKFDAGEISAKDWKLQERALLQQEQTLRDQSLLARVPQPTAPKGNGDELYLQTVTKDLEDSHPYIHAFSDDVDFEFLRQKAQSHLAANGVELKNDAGTKLMLRQTMCQLASDLGPRMFPDFKVPGAQPAPQPAAQPSAAAQARGAKLDLRASLPPVLTDIPPAGGNATGSLGGYTEDQIMAMDEETLANLPKATRDAILHRMA